MVVPTCSSFVLSILVLSWSIEAELHHLFLESFEDNKMAPDARPKLHGETNTVARNLRGKMHTSLFSPHPAGFWASLMEAEKKEAGQYVIAVHSAPYGRCSATWDTGVVGSGGEPCPYSCKFLGMADDSQCKDANAVFIDTSNKDLPSWTKPQEQMWIGAHWEAPSHYPAILDEQYMNHFDYTSSYRLNSTFPSATMMTDTTGKFESVLNKPLQASLAEKRNSGYLMSVWISNCGTDSANRLDLVKELENHGVKGASYGTCGHNSDIPQQFVGEQSGMQKVHTSAQYPFLYAAENALCPHYHTEKIFHAFMAGVVPVYLGDDETVDQWIPPNSAIKVADFNTVDDLAAHLKKVANDEELYNSYLAWREQPLPDKMQALVNHPKQSRCEICTFLRTNDKHGAVHAEKCKTPPSFVK